MNEDIVIQLREIEWHDAKTWVDKMAQAANEIERLRKLINNIEYSCPNCECRYCLGQEGAT
jgi:hypothetical protein